MRDILDWVQDHPETTIDIRAGYTNDQISFLMSKISNNKLHVVTDRVKEECIDETSFKTELDRIYAKLAKEIEEEENGKV